MSFEVAIFYRRERSPLCGGDYAGKAQKDINHQ
jgi:hypothetical protein